MPSSAPKLRQTVLNFKNVSPGHAVEPTAKGAGSSRPAPELPQEIWLQIVDFSSTIALKTLRLICRSWSNIATSQLFHTVYLDSFDQSWLRLSELAASPLASLVQCIVWNPLYLPEKCLDAEHWQQCYPILLKGSTHAERILLHQTFREMYRTVNYNAHRKRNLVRKSDYSSMVNCHRFVLADDVDIETRCADQHLCRRIRYDEELVRQPATWGVRPRLELSWTPEVDAATSFSYAYDLFTLAVKIPSLMQMHISAHGDNVSYILAEAYKQPKMMHSLTHAHVKIRYHYHQDVDFSNEPVRYALCKTLGWIATFPSIQHLSLEPVYTNPDPKYMNEYRSQRALDWNDNDSDDDDSDKDDDSISSSSSSSSNSSVCSRLSQIDGAFQDHPVGFTRGHVNALHAELHMLITAIPNLKTLELHDVSFNAQNLLGWLCNQPQLPVNRIELRLRGHIIIHGLSPSRFLRILNSINVDLAYEKDKTICYETRYWGQTPDIDKLGTVWRAHSARAGSSGALEMRLHPAAGTYEMSLQCIIEQSPSFRLLADADKGKGPSGPPRGVSIAERPEYITGLCRTLDYDLAKDKEYFYCYFDFDGQVNFAWINAASYAKCPCKRLYILLHACCQTSDDGYSDYYDDPYYPTGMPLRGGYYPDNADPYCPAGRPPDVSP